jgi:diaminopimelate epimerase
MMRPASLSPADVGLAADKPLIDAPVEVGARALRLTAVSMGNPHAVTFDDVGEMRLTLGPLLEKHVLFSRGANAGFAHVTGSNSLDLRVYERGAGWTEACGTGACAAAVAAVETSRARRGEPVAVRLPGGVLKITVFERGSRVRMTGPARHVFDGVVSA